MTLTSRIIEALARRGWLPKRGRLRIVSQAIGVLFRDVMDDADTPAQRRRLGEIMYARGQADAVEVAQQLHIDHDLRGAAVAMLATEATFGIRSRIIHESPDEIVIEAHGCPWGEIEGWTPAHCAAFDRYEAGLAEGIDPDLRYSCSRRRTQGHACCEARLRLRPLPGAPEPSEGDLAVRRYYDENQAAYDLLWSSDALHFGLWEPDVRSTDQALERGNQRLCELLELEPGQRLLDAGCGVGSTAVFAAEHLEVDVLGINTSDVQLGVAPRPAPPTPPPDPQRIERPDKTATRLPDGGFHGIVAYESANHAADKGALLRELHRLLEPGGRLVLADLFLVRQPETAAERAAVERFTTGWVRPEIPTRETFERQLVEAGFEEVCFHDRTAEVRPTRWRIALVGWLSLPATWLLGKLGVLPASAFLNAVGCIQQRRLDRLGLCAYGVFVVRKEQRRLSSKGR